ncbi:ATP-binding protein [Epibacterium sp. Ofav1-8]|uniref:ATP-binding protein n=1 Tax=Epibacterium sp. Ofav1-8 TaxID=2917735 RepID=UPI001EF5DB6E|nr:ATP-binding protein [Epibacterium sp. Ofav1-8]MCG7624994.1 ATP-binding protein [Epibacterium sp. Ofav1-8]
MTDEALAVVEAGSHMLLYASPRAMDLLYVASPPDATCRLTDLLNCDDGHLLRFLNDAATVTSPLISRVRRLSDGAALTAKGQRVAGEDGRPLIAVALKADTELSRRFRLLADKITALDLEIEHRKAVESELSRNALARDRTLVAVRHIAEIESGDPASLNHALDVLWRACGCPGAAVIGVEAGQLLLRALNGRLAGSFDMNASLCLPMGLADFWDMPEADRAETLRSALDEVAKTPCDLSDLTVWPLFVGSEAKSCLVLQGPCEFPTEVEILSEAVASLLSRVNVETELRHAQKLQAIGELTGGIAHDFNNILSVILGNAELIIDGIEKDRPEALEMELANAIRDATLRGATLTSRLLSFARKQPLMPQSLSLNTVLRDLDPLLRRALGEIVDIEVVWAGGLWKTRLDQGQFENALLNLAVNARDAMPDGGRLTIETANTRLDTEYAAQHLEVTPGQYVMIAVSDTGTGMTPDVIREAFTPFFTTKGVGQGSGLGLSMVFGFVKQSGGHVKIYSEPGQGTSVKMYFPRDTAASGTGSGEQLASAALRASANGFILLVEDDPHILRYAERTLILLGYEVDTALTGDTAAELLQSRSYDILLTDVILPGSLNGRRLADLAYELWPTIKVLFMSGYTENAIVHNGQLDPEVELISKPFTRDQLARRLQKLRKQ